ncbi:MAG: HAMP domain-containing protein [Thiomicrospira sp.]|uniref:methyl-accepting chemotaxis protein n=1 Tax=Thiomicrospira sp. TaxID=935 RepID=UPI0019F87E26|nr:methyl-accepting chemotaxis protein [Thiomicrospira sp.]MBE0493174.1 HAMP domain-containing protein [Thiomicrospira sp.]
MLNSISAKLLFRMILVSAAGLVIGLGMVFKSSSDLQQTTAENFAFEKREQSLMLINSKVEATLNTVQGIVAGNPNIGQFFLDNDHQGLHDITTKVAADFKRSTDYNNLAFVAFDRDNQIFVRSFVPLPDPAIGKKAPRDFSDLLRGRQHSSANIDLSGVGLFITASVPIMAPNTHSDVVGVLDIRTGLGSIVDQMASDGAYMVALINETGLKRWAKGAETPKIGAYNLAHQSWFNQSSLWFEGLDIDNLIANEFSITNNKVISSAPIISSDGHTVGYYLIGMDSSHPDMVNAMEGVNNVILIMFLLIIGLIVALMLFLWHASKTIITKPIQSILNAIREVEQTGKIDTQLDSKSRDEVGAMTRAFASLLHQINQALNEANQTVSAIAQGDFSQSMQGEYRGDLRRLKEGVNASAQSVSFMMDELSKVMQALKDGQFNVRMDEKVAPNFRALVEGALHSMETVMLEINQTLSGMQQGQFNLRVEAHANGELLTLKNHVNESLSALESAIKEINQIMAAQAKGDLSQTIQGEYQGELDELKRAINASSEQLNKIVTDAIEVSSQVTNAADEVSRGAMDLSDRVQQQAASVEETSATMEQMNSAVQNTNDHAKRAAEVAHEVQGKAQQGNNVMADTIEAMSSIQQSSHKISEIVTLIDGIAFQTNLLALNAAVEAARAGDHGRGFAVVAGEVRALAQKSAEAAKDIKNLIDESVGRIDQGTKLATESGEVLAQIMGSVEQVSGMIEQIAQASTEQAEGISQVNKAIAQIDSGTQQNAALVEETSAAAESLNEQAQVLRDDMSRFKTKQHNAALSKPVAPKLVKPKPAKLETTQTHLSEAVEPKQEKTLAPASQLKPAMPLAKQPSKPADKDEWAEF